MHDIEPYYHWRHLYTAEEDARSPFFGQTYSEFEFSQTVYNYYIHPQWDSIGSKTLYVKIIYADYELGFAIIEMIGEWNDAIENDIMTFKREVLEKLMDEGIHKFILITESVFNFHNGDKDYYEELYDELADEDGWAVMVNFHKASQHDFLLKKLNRYIELMEFDNWRTYKPEDFFHLIDKKLNDRLT
ncbi:MAG: hypothetical protein ACK4V7_06930 [Chitinophagaceae bacterium]|jgi:hypothetical protein|nr:hypothetical protein [Sediminibacterium sp.]